MGMASVSFFLMFAFFHLVHTYPYSDKEEQDKFNKNCPPLSCRGLGDGEITFPYSNSSRQPYCGPFVVDGCDNKNQQIRFKKGGRKYDVESISQGNIIHITDTEFRRKLDSNSCDTFSNISLPTSPYALFQLKSSNLTLLKCLKKLNATPDLDFNHTACDDFNIHYTHLNTSSKNIGPFPPECSVLQLPINESNDYGDIFRLLTPKFFLEVQLQFGCFPCLFNESKCQRDGIFDFPDCRRLNDTPPGRPDNENKGKRVNDTPPGTPDNENKALGLGLGLGLGCPAVIMIILFIWFRYKRNRASKNSHSSNTSTDHSSQLYQDEQNVYFRVPIFSYDVLQEATNNFDSNGELGDGGFGTAYYGKLQDGREVAVKRLYEHNYNRVKQFMNEIDILACLRHKNLVSLYGCTSHRCRDLLLVYEYISNGTVADHLHGEQAKFGLLNWPTRMRIAIETATALSYLHNSDIIHRDVKTGNILLDKNFCVKVADFGISKLFPNGVTHVSTAPQGTPGYVDPEYYHCYQLTNKSDVYSFGVVLIELISSMPAVDITRHRHEINLASFAMNKIQKCAFEELIDPSLGYSSDREVERMTTSVAELAFRCLQQEMEMRPSMDEVLEELKSIESNEYESDVQEWNQEDNHVTENAEAQFAILDISELTLLKKIQSPPFPNSAN